MDQAHAVVLERNRPVGRRVARLLGCAGFAVTSIEDPNDLAAALSRPTTLLGCDAVDLDRATRAARAHADLRLLLFSAEPLERLLPRAMGPGGPSSFFGRPEAGAAPRGRELLLVARRLGGAGRVPFAAHLDWGFAAIEERPSTSARLERAVAAAEKFAEHTGCARRLATSVAELAHELLMNAMYDAPVGADGQPRFAHDRRAEVSLSPAETPSLRLGSDGTTLCIQVVDPFGRLERAHVFGGLVRGLAGGSLDTSRGGAGLGLLKMHQATSALFFDVAPGARTEVTGIIDLELAPRDARARPKSLHFFEGPP